MVKTQFNSTIKILRTDHGGEYTSHDFTSYLLSHGITHQFSCPYTPEQNGIAERKNRHLLETARTLLHHASLPFQFWLEATSTATYLLNRLPSKTLHMQSPYQKLYNKSPSFLHLKTFGCLCYPWTAYTRTHKLDPKSSPCIFLGYSSDHKGFRCFDPTTSKLITSRHVRFHETEFPMATLLSFLKIPNHHESPPSTIPCYHPFYPPSTHHSQPLNQHPPNHQHPPSPLTLLPATLTPISNTNAATLHPLPYPPPPYLPSYLYPNHPSSPHLNMTHP